MNAWIGKRSWQFRRDFSHQVPRYACLLMGRVCPRTFNILFVYTFRAANTASIFNGNMAGTM
jgi:hypothetical protein